MNEPTAASLAYGLDRVGEELRIVVIDFGGGTLDVTILDIDGNVALLSYTGLEPVDMTASTVVDMVLNLPAGADNAELTNIGGGNLRFASTASPQTFERTDFTFPTGKLTINGGTVNVGVANAHGTRKIDFRNNAHGGATFRFTLPAAKREIHDGR